MVKNPPANAGDSRVQSLGGEDPLEKETRSSILAWNIPWTGDPGRLQFRGLQRVRHDKHIHTHTQRLEYPMGSGLSSCWETRNQRHETSFLSQFFEFTKYNYFELFLEVYFHEAHYFSRFQQSISCHEISSSKYIKGACKISKHILIHNFLLMIIFKHQFSR